MSCIQKAPESCIMSEEKCPACGNLIPLLDTLSQRFLDLQEGKPKVYGEELCYNLDKAFDSLYDAIDRRETDMLASVEDACRDLHPETHLTSLLTQLENAEAYCDKALVYTTKPEFLHFTGKIGDRVEELLQEGIQEESAPVNDINFRDDGIPDLLTEIETFGKIFNEKDVNVAVQEKSFHRNIWVLKKHQPE